MKRINPSRLIVVMLSLQWIFLFGNNKRNDRRTKPNCGKTCRKLSDEEILPIYLYHRWVSMLFSHSSSLRFSNDEFLLLLMAQTLSLMYIQSPVTIVIKVVCVEYGLIGISYAYVLVWIQLNKKKPARVSWSIAFQ